MKKVVEVFNFIQTAILVSDSINKSQVPPTRRAPLRRGFFAIGTLAGFATRSVFCARAGNNASERTQ